MLEASRLACQRTPTHCCSFQVSDAVADHDHCGVGQQSTAFKGVTAGVVMFPAARYPAMEDDGVYRRANESNCRACRVDSEGLQGSGAHPMGV